MDCETVPKTQFTDWEFSGEHELTVGVEFGVRLLTLQNTKVKLQIWDTVPLVESCAFLIRRQARSLSVQ